MSSQCLTFGFSSASFIMYFSNLLLFSLYTIFFSVYLFPCMVSSVMPYSSCIFLIPSLHMLFPCVNCWISPGSSLVSTLFACMFFSYLHSFLSLVILFLLIVWLWVFGLGVEGWF